MVKGTGNVIQNLNVISLVEWIIKQQGETMFRIVDLSEWKFSYEKMVSGTRKKTWVRNETDSYLFKEPKHDFNEVWAEKVAAELGEAIGLKTMEVHFSRNGENIGVILKNYVKKTDSSIDGAEILSAYIDDFNPLSLEDYYIENIIESLNRQDYLPYVITDLIDQFIFDILIANQDRHCENWAIITNSKNEDLTLAPIYDNGSSLGFNVAEDIMKKYVSGEKQLSSFNNKSKSIIGVNSQIKPKAKMLFLYLYESFPEEVIRSCNEIGMLTDKHINQITHRIPASIMTRIQKEFVKKLLLSRKEMILGWLKECEGHE